MTAKTIKATFDGVVFRPSEPVEMEPNSAVVLTVEPDIEPATGGPYSFLLTLESLELEGPTN